MLKGLLCWVQGARLLEDIVRWGVESVFAEAPTGGASGATPMDVDGTVTAFPAARLPQEALQKLVVVAEKVRSSGSWSLQPSAADAAAAVAAANGNSHAATGDVVKLQPVDLGAPLAGAAVREWQAGDCEDDDAVDAGACSP